MILILFYVFESSRISALVEHADFFVDKIVRWDPSSGLHMFFLFLETQKPPTGNDGL